MRFEIVSKSLTLLGDPGDAAAGPGVNAPVVDGGSTPGSAFFIANGVSNVTIQGFEMRNYTSNDTGIGNGISAWVGSTSNITIQDNYFHDLEYNGILVGNDYSTNPSKWGDHTNWLIKGNVADRIGYIVFELTNTSSSSIEGNVIHLDNTYIGAIFSSARRSESDLTFKDNVIDGTPSTVYPVIYVYAYDLDMPNPNLDGLVIEGNTINTVPTTLPPYQVDIRNIGTGTVTNVDVHYNTLSTLRNRTAAEIDAEHNYWGTVAYSEIVPKISGSVDWSPWCNSDFSLCTYAWPVHNITQAIDYQTIQSAIDAAVAGDEILADAGTYAEHVTINKDVTVSGAVGAIIDGSGTGVVVDMTANGATLEGFTIRNSGATANDAGVRLYNVTGCTVESNTVNANALGIVAVLGSGNSIGSNAVSGNTYYGIALVASTGNTIELNNVTGNGLDAIALDNASAVGGSVTTGSTGNYIKGNTITSNRDGIFLGENCDGNYVTDGNQLYSITSIGISNWRSDGQTITDNIISGAATGIRLLGSSNNTISGNFVTGNGVGIKADASWQVGVWYQSASNTITDNDISGNTDYGVLCGAEQTDVVNASGNWWGSADPATVKAETFGPVDYTPWLAVGTDVGGDPSDGFQGDFSTLWVDDDSAQTGTTGRIQEGVNLVSGSTVNVAAGTYVENIWINKSLELAGAGAASVTVYPAVSLPNPCEGSSLCGSRTAASNIILTEASDITIHGFTLDGDNPGLTSGLVRGGADLDARNGIIEYGSAGVFNNLKIYETTVKNIYLRGIYANSYGSGFNFHHNTVQNVQGEANSIAIFNFGGSGTVANNIVSDANDAIAANHSKGTQFLNNVVTNSGSGVHTDNNGSMGGVADLIQGNDVTCSGSGYGVWVFYPYLAATLDNNTVTGCDVGLSAWAQGAAVTALFTNNTVTGPSKAAGSAGVYITTDSIGWGYTDVSVDLRNNIVTDFETAVYLTADEQTWNPDPYEEKTIYSVFYDNSFAGNTNGMDIGTDGTYNADASANWWGSADPATVKVAANGGSIVDYTPWLAAGTDTSTDPGFQGDFSTLWVDDDSPQTGTTGRIQEGINLVSGSTVHVAAGEYAETVNIENRTDLSLIGENRVTTIIKPTTTLPWDVGGYGSSRLTTFRVVNSTNVLVQNLTIDCDVVKTNLLWATLFWDTTGTLDNNIIQNTSLPDVPSGYYEFGSAFRGVGFTDGARANITISNNIYKDTGRIGIHAHDYVNLTITGNTIYKTTDDFGYGMEIGSQSEATISGNTIYGYDTPAASDNSNSGGIYIENAFTASSPHVVKNVTLTGNEIYDSQWALCIGNEFDGYAGDVDIVVTATGNNFHDNVDGAVTIADEDKAAGSSVTYSGSGNTLADNGGDGYYISTSGDGDITVSLDDETITGNGVGLHLEDLDATPPTGSTYNVSVHDSTITGNTSFGVQNEYSGTTIDAEHNWWGCACGPSGEGPGCGDAVSTYVDFSPWWSDAAMTIEGPIAGANLTIPTGATTEEAQGVLDCAGPNSTVTFESGSYQGPLYLNNDGITLKLNGCSIGAPGPAFNIVGDDEVIQGPGKIDGGGGGGAGILVMGGAGNFILEGVQVTGWANGVELAGSVTSFKLVNNWIHSNTANGLLIDTGVTLDGIVTIEGNLFKVNGGNGIQHNGNGTLPAEYNSWGHVGGPASGDGVGGSVDTDPFTYFESFFDVYPDTLAPERHVMEATSFNVALKADAVNIYGLTFKFTYDTAKLTLNSTTFSAPWAGQCIALPGSPVGTVYYYCGLYNPTPEWTAAAGTIATFNFTAFTGTPGNGPWEALFDLSHVEVDTSAAAIGGQKVFVNNAGFNDPSAPDRDITDANDGKVFIERGANYTGLVDLQGRANDSGATIKIYSGALKTSTLLAQGSTNSAGAYTTSWVVPQWLGVNYTYYMVVDRYLYLPTTVMADDLHPLPLEWAHNKLLDMYPLTTLLKVKLLGGDATNDDYIDITDLSCIGGYYALAPGVCGADGTADVTGDGLVDILDLSLSAGNYYLDASPWTP